MASARRNERHFETRGRLDAAAMYHAFTASAVLLLLFYCDGRVHKNVAIFMRACATSGLISGADFVDAPNVARDDDSSQASFFF